MPPEETTNMSSKLAYHRWYIDEAEIMKEQLTTTQMGELFFAVMDYVRDETISDVSSEIKYAYADCIKKVERSKNAYNKKIAALAANGAKGGRAKAANTKGAECVHTNNSAFTPPTKKQFLSAVEHMINEGIIPDDVSEYAVDSLFDNMKEDGWKIDGEPLRRRSDWETLIEVNLTDSSSSNNPYLFRKAYRYIFKTYHGLRTIEGDSLASSIAYIFVDDYDETIKGWSIQGVVYKLSDWSTALERYLEEITKNGTYEGQLLANASFY